MTAKVTPLGAVLRDLWAGIDAANAIRHGLPAPDAARVPVAPKCREDAAPRAVSAAAAPPAQPDGVRVYEGGVPFR